MSTFEAELEELRRYPEKLRRTQEEIRFHLSAKEPAKLCRGGCNGRLMERVGRVYVAYAGMKVEINELTYYCCERCGGSFASFGQLNQLFYSYKIQDFWRGDKVLLSPGGYEIQVRSEEPYHMGELPLNFTKRQLERSARILALQSISAA